MNFQDYTKTHPTASPATTVTTPTGGKPPMSFQDFVKTNPPPQAQPGAVQGFVQGLAKLPLKFGSTIYNTVTAAGDIGASGLASLAGDKGTADRLMRQAGAEISQQHDFGYLGKASPIGYDQGTGEKLSIGRSVEDIVGTGLEGASWMIGGGGSIGALKTGLKGLLIDSAIQGTKAGTQAGFLGSLGVGLQEGQTPGELAVNTTIGTVGGAAIGGVLGPATTALTHGVPALAKFGIAKASGLENKTIDTALTRGAELKAANASGFGRDAVKNKVQGAFDTLETNISDVGEAYNPIRNSGATVEIPQGYWRNRLNAVGVQTGADGLVSRETSRVMTNADKSAIDDFLITYGKEGATSADDFLRAREALANIAKYDAQKTPVSGLVSQNLRADLNSSFRSQVPGLEALDAKYAPLRDFLKETKSIIDRNGDVKLSKVVNSLKRGREDALATLEKLHPGISKDLEILSALEDIELASGHKVGTYAQNILFGGGIGTIFGGGVGGFAGVLVSNPKIIIPILEHFSIGKNMLRTGLDAILKKILTGVKPNTEEMQIVTEAINEAMHMQSSKPLALPAPAIVTPVQDKSGLLTQEAAKARFKSYGEAKPVPQQRLGLPAPSDSNRPAIPMRGPTTIEPQAGIIGGVGQSPANPTPRFSRLELPAPNDSNRPAIPMGGPPFVDKTKFEPRAPIVGGEGQTINLGKRPKTVEGKVVGKRTTVKKAESPLIAEAKKYKTAESFVKAQQFKKISMENPMSDSYHTGIRSASDINTFKEVLNDSESFVNPDFTREMAEKASKSGEITIYSSKPLDESISQFVTPSKMMAGDYAGSGKVYSKKVNVNDVAWISGDEGNFVGKSQLLDIYKKAHGK